MNSNRRSFLQATAGAVGVLGGVSLTGLSAEAAHARAAQGGPEQRLRDLGITLPEPQQASATLVPAVLSGNILYCSGHGPRPSVTGKVGTDVTLEDATAAARSVGINMLATVKNMLGNLDRVARVVKVLGMVNAVPDFTGQSRVINGFSQLMIDVFGEELGKGARSAVGVGSLPGGWAVEIEAIFEVRT